MWRPGLLAFAASCATLVLQLVAGRLLAPYIGVSLHTWTAVIGVTLAGISMGSWLGGLAAERARLSAAMSVVFVGAGLVEAVAVVMLPTLAAAVGAASLLLRILTLTAALLLPVSTLLGMVAPLAVKLALGDPARAGRSIGLVFALGTFGSLTGTFLTGFVLVAHMAVSTIAWVSAGVLVGIGAMASRLPAPASGAPPLPPAGESVARQRAVRASAIAGIASFCTMAIELAASRILAPHVGVSLFSWTGIIGVVLCAMALGNYLGGRLADRWLGSRLLAGSLFAAGLAALAILALLPAAVAAPALAELGLIERIVLLTLVIFGLPVLLLGTISPQVVRWALADHLGWGGEVAGRIYAWSTAGAIAGTFATGLLLIRLVGVFPLVLGAGLGLVGLALVVGRVWRRPAALAGALALTTVAVVLLQATGALSSRCTRETDYFCIRVVDEWPVPDEEPIRKLVLDRLVHSSVRLNDPRYLGYPHEQVQVEVTAFVVGGRSTSRVMVIGGGGYTYPRWVDTFIPGAQVEVVEIDPGVTEVAHAELGLPRDTAIRSFHMDGRQFVVDHAPSSVYDVVILDAVNDFSVPYHLLTRELDEAARRLLTPRGVYMVSVIDQYEDGQLLPAVLRTMAEVFPRVQLFSYVPRWSIGGSGVFVVVGSADGVPADRLQRLGGGPSAAHELDEAALRAYVARGRQIVLTDDYVPVDNLIAGLFRERG